jgi:putative FmdB family regulatory protein
MPIYEYECLSCGEDIEIVHGISEKPRKKCPSCGGRLKRLISLNSFHLKGTGWYKTDYAKPDTDRQKTGPDKAGEKAKTETSKKTAGKKEAAGSTPL